MNQYTSESKIEGQGISIPWIYNLQKHQWCLFNLEIFTKNASIVCIV
jgi:hypothetical protein